MSQASTDHISNGNLARGADPPRAGGSRRATGIRGAVAVLASAAALAAPAALPGPAVAASPGITAKLSAPTHTPKVGGEKISITVTKGKLKLSGSVKYQFYFPGLGLVSTQPGHKFTNGLYRDTLLWPASAVGKKLTVKIIITTPYGTTSIDYWFEVRA